MDKRIAPFNKEQKIALARIVSDLILADKIIEDSEVEKFSKLFGEKHSRELFRSAQSLTFAQAMKLLTCPQDKTEDSDLIRKKNASDRKKYAETAAEILLEIANSDGYCAPSEAILLSSIDYYLKRNNSSYTKYDIQSYRLRDVFIGKRFVLYADFSNNPLCCTIEKHYDLIVNLLASIGFQFVYIPKLIDVYDEKGLKMFKKMAMYIFPDIRDEKIEDVYHKIKGITTKKFIQEYLNDKLGFNISCPKPSLMVMIGRSSRLGNDLSQEGLPYETYANFFKIKIGDDDILDVISEFVNNYNKHVAFNLNIDFNPAKDKLMYHGIHRAFFRLVALSKEKPSQYNIEINTSLGAIFINENKMKLPLGIVAIYALILCRSFYGDKKGLPLTNAYKTLSETEKEEIQKQYERICGYLNNHDPKTRAPLYPNVYHRISVIRNELIDIVGKRYISEIQLGVGDYVITHINPDHVTVNGIPISEHTKWNNIIN